MTDKPEVKRLLKQLAMDEVPKIEMPASRAPQALIGSVTVGGDMIVVGDASGRALEAVLGRRRQPGARDA